MTAQQSKAITRAVNRLCGELREQALPLVDAFAIPESLLGPIAR
jgi:acyl-CoA oxidase